MAETTNGAQEIFGNFCECTARCSSSRHKFPFKNFLTNFKKKKNLFNFLLKVC